MRSRDLEAELSRRSTERAEQEQAEADARAQAAEAEIEQAARDREAINAAIREAAKPRGANDRKDEE